MTESVRDARPGGDLGPSSFSEGICEASHPPPNALINWTLATIRCARKLTAVFLRYALRRGRAPWDPGSIRHHQFDIADLALDGHLLQCAKPFHGVGEELE